MPARGLAEAMPDPNQTPASNDSESRALGRPIPRVVKLGGLGGLRTSRHNIAVTLPPALRNFVRLVFSAIRDLTPIILVIAFFQIFVLQQPLPNLPNILAGLVLVICGLAFFIQGLEMGLFPMGGSMADDFANKGSLTALLAFAFGLGFGTTVAEPALIAVAAQAADVAAVGGYIADDIEARDDYANALRFTVAVSVGVSLVVGVIRIIKGWPIHYLIIAGYLIIVLLTTIAPDEIIAIAYDSGGVTTSTITVPLVTALGVGLAHAIRGRNPLIDGFGLIAFASLMPIIFVLVFGIVS
jgi:hypothetical protein